MLQRSVWYTLGSIDEVRQARLRRLDCQKADMVRFADQLLQLDLGIGRGDNPAKPPSWSQLVPMQACAACARSLAGHRLIRIAERRRLRQGADGASSSMGALFRCTSQPAGATFSEEIEI